MGEVTVLFDSLVTDLRNFDPSVYRSWLEGEVVRVAARQRDIIAPSDDTARLFAGRWNELLFRETQDQFRAFQRLEHFLQRPKIWLGDTLEHELPDGVCRWMIERYYDFDDSVARELAGKKMSSKLRKDLDDVAQSSSVSLASCQRQFDNFKRVGHEVSTAETDTIALIVERFCLSPDLARRYAAFLFLAHHRIDLSKRCLASLTYPVVETLAEIMMHEWTRPDSGTLALDENLSERARDLKAVVTATRSGIDELRDLVRQRVVEAWGIRRGETATRRFVRSSDAWSRVESRIPSVLRGIFGVCGSLHNAREFKDVLVVTVERVAEPLMKAGLSDMMVGDIFDALAESLLDVRSVRASDAPLVRETWMRVLCVVRACVLHVYPLM